MCINEGSSIPICLSSIAAMFSIALHCGRIHSGISVTGNISFLLTIIGDQMLTSCTITAHFHTLNNNYNMLKV